MSRKKVSGDPTRLRQILLNLTSNAVSSPTEGGVTLRVLGKKSTLGNFVVRFEIEDTGIGMPERTTARAFTAFQQADSSTARRFGGTGLGLAICQRLDILMGGEIQRLSTVGEGSTPSKSRWGTTAANICIRATILAWHRCASAASIARRRRRFLTHMVSRRSSHHAPRSRGPHNGSDRSAVASLIILNTDWVKTSIGWRIRSAEAAAPRNIILAAPQITLAALKLDWTAFANTRFLGTLDTPIQQRTRRSASPSHAIVAGRRNT